MEKINVLRGIFRNWVFSAIILVTVIFQVIIVEFLGAFASTVPLSWQFWVLSVILGSISLIIGAILKCIPVEPRRKSIEKPNGYEPIPVGPDGV
jgi:P-type Ca2+ transporter type 2C